MPMNKKSKRRNIKKVLIKNFLKQYKINISKEWWAIFISIIALLISLYASGLFSSFELNTHVDGTYISPPENPKEVLIFTIPIGFSNTGRKSVIIEDLFVEINYEDKNVKYVPQYEQDLLYANEVGSFGINLASQPYISFGLKPDDTKIKVILFSVNNFSESLLINRGEYGLKLFIKTQKDDVPKLTTTITFKISDSAEKEYLDGKTLFLKENKISIFPRKQ